MEGQERISCDLMSHQMDHGDDEIACLQWVGKCHVCDVPDSEPWIQWQRKHITAH